MKPEVSVLMPVYNGAEFVGRAVDSILRQTLENLELIIIDDGSTDETWKVLKELAERDRRVRIFRNEINVGIPGTSNRALSLARGKFIARQDADDWSYPERLEKQVRYMEKHEDIVAVGTFMLLVEQSGLPIRLWRVPLIHEEIDLRHINGFSLQLPHGTMVARTEAMTRIGGYKEDHLFGSDYEMMLRLTEVGRVANLPEVLYRYILHKENTTDLYRDNYAPNKKVALREAWKRRGLGELPFQVVPNPAMKFREGSRMVSLFVYGLKNVLRKPDSREGWSALKGSAARLVRKWGNRNRKVT